MRHGTTSGYTYHKCRCAECTEAWRVYHAEKRAYWGDPKHFVWDMPWHGSNTGYTSYGCRCDDCKDANREYRKNRSKK